MQYLYSRELTEKAQEIAALLELEHVDSERISCVLSKGSKTRRVIARIHSFGKALQTGMQTKPFYVIELISEKFDKLSEKDKTKTLIHELLHIPHSFGGGFRHHRKHVNSRTVDHFFAMLSEKKFKM